jgi:nucleotide-binding universal stress UspA family protein
MKTLLVATDLSSAASNAAKYAAEMALAIKADILLLNVYQLPVVFTEIPVALDLDEMIDAAEKEMVELKTMLTTHCDGKVNIETKVVSGEFFQQLETVCEQISPYAVLMGSQGKTAAEHFLFGRHTVYAMRHLKWPLITVPPGAKFSSIKRIALACDYDKVTDTVPVDEVKSLVNQFNAEMHLINVGKRDDFNPEIIFQSGILHEKLKALKPINHFLSNEDTDEGIIEFVEKNRIDLLLVVPKRHGLLGAMMHKSHAKQLILHSHVPVMVLHV